MQGPRGTQGRDPEKLVGSDPDLGIQGLAVTQVTSEMIELELKANMRSNQECSPGMRSGPARCWIAKEIVESQGETTNTRNQGEAPDQETGNPQGSEPAARG